MLFTVWEKPSADFIYICIGLQHLLWFLLFNCYSVKDTRKILYGFFPLDLENSSQLEVSCRPRHTQVGWDPAERLLAAVPGPWMWLDVLLICFRETLAVGCRLACGLGRSRSVKKLPHVPRGCPESCCWALGTGEEATFDVLLFSFVGDIISISS